MSRDVKYDEVFQLGTQFAEMLSGLEPEEYEKKKKVLEDLRNKWQLSKGSKRSPSGLDIDHHGSTGHSLSKKSTGCKLSHATADDADPSAPQPKRRSAESRFQEQTESRDVPNLDDSETPTEHRASAKSVVRSSSSMSKKSHGKNSSMGKSNVNEYDDAVVPFDHEDSPSDPRNFGDHDSVSAFQQEMSVTSVDDIEGDLSQDTLRTDRSDASDFDEDPSHTNVSSTSQVSVPRELSLTHVEKTRHSSVTQPVNGDRKSRGKTFSNDVRVSYSQSEADVLSKRKSKGRASSLSKDPFGSPNKVDENEGNTSPAEPTTQQNRSKSAMARKRTQPAKSASGTDSETENLSSKDDVAIQRSSYSMIDEQDETHHDSDSKKTSTSKKESSAATRPSQDGSNKSLAVTTTEYNRVSSVAASSRKKSPSWTRDSKANGTAKTSKTADSGSENQHITGLDEDQVGVIEEVNTEEHVLDENAVPRRSAKASSKASTSANRQPTVARPTVSWPLASMSGQPGQKQSESHNDKEKRPSHAADGSKNSTKLGDGILDEIQQDEAFVPCDIVSEFSNLLAKEYSSTFTGFRPPDALNVACRHDREETLQFIRSEMTSGSKGCIQSLICDHQYYLSTKPKNAAAVTVFSSLNSELPDGIKLQLFDLYNVENQPIEISVPAVYKPSRLHLSGPMVCAWMADIVKGKKAEDAAYEEEELRHWLAHCMQNKRIELAPRQPSSSKFTRTSPPQKKFQITREQADQLREHSGRYRAGSHIRV